MDAAKIAELKKSRYNGTVVRLHKSHSDLMTIRVRPDGPIAPHRAGQYTTLGLGRWEPRFPGTQIESATPDEELRVVRRAYSISCPILDDHNQLLPSILDWLEFYIVLVRDSGDAEHPPMLTPRLFMLREGDRLQIGDKITGHFTLRDIKPNDSVVFLSTGTGEAPHNYMVWELLRQNHPGLILSACCVRYSKDLGYLKTHETLMQRYANYRYLSLTTRELQPNGQKTYIQDLITSGQLETHLGQQLDPASCHVYLCGNPKMIGVPEKGPNGERSYPRPTGVIEILEQRGFVCDDPASKVHGNIHFEKYW